MLRQNFIAIAIAAAMLTGTARAADIKVPPLATPKEIPVQQNQPNCSRWTDDCVNCTRGGDGSASICSNPGFACQPKAVRCLGGDIPQSEPRKR